MSEFNKKKSEKNIEVEEEIETQNKLIDFGRE